jgi:hypothetical protein
VNPLDAWSGLGATTWDFGDGASAAGTAVSHAYATAGDKTVTVSSTDALNQTTTRTRTITVTSAAAPPVPPTDTTTPQPPTDTTPPVGPGSTDTPKAPCVSRRVIELRPRVPTGRRTLGLTLAITGRKTTSLRRDSETVTVDLRGVTLPQVTVKITAKLKSGKVVTDTRTYKTCGR